MTEPATCPIREHEQRFAHLEHIMDLRIQAADKALIVQATEYQRRLAELNHAAERLLTAQEKFVNADIYRVQHAALETKVDIVMRLVFVGVGAVAALQVLLHFIVK